MYRGAGEAPGEEGMLVDTREGDALGVRATLTEVSWSSLSCSVANLRLI